MFKETALSGQTTFFQKLRSMDYILLVCILILGVIISLAMYATDGGELLYHTKSHALRFIIFFGSIFFSFKEYFFSLNWKKLTKFELRTTFKSL